MSTSIGRIEMCRDIPSIAVALREQVPTGSDCTVFADDLGGVFFVLGKSEVEPALRVCHRTHPWTAPEIAQALLANARKRGLV